MRKISHSLSLPGAPSAYELTSFHFGAPGAGPKVYIQGGLHADEVPGLLTAQLLRARLAVLEEAGRLRGEIVLVPAANPIGLAQSIQGVPFGRFDMATGINFNRAYRHVAAELKESLRGKLGADAQANVALVRAHARAAVAAWHPQGDTGAMKKVLLGLAIDADVVLDLHCDNEALVHLYAGTPLAERVAPLAALLGAEAVLVALTAGGEPFDEACSALWWDLAAHFGPDVPLPPACLAVTVELRGEMDVDYDLARQDAEALVQFLVHERAIDLPPVPLPAPRCAPTPLEGVEPLHAPCAGILVFVRRMGERVEAGETVAELTDTVTGAVTPLCAGVSGLFFARTAHRFVLRGMQVAKIAGAAAYRSGNLLSL